VSKPIPGQVPRFLREPVAVICEVVVATEPELDPAVVAETIRTTVGHRPRQRELAQALQARPDLLTSGRPEGPLAVQKLIRALQAVGARNLVLPRCARCGKQYLLRNLDGAVRICTPCTMRKHAAERPCVVCGRTAHVTTRDRNGQPRCPRCPPEEDRDPVEQVCEVVEAVDPGISRSEIATALLGVAGKPAHQRRLAWALEDNPALLTGEGAHGSPQLLALIAALLAHGAVNIVMPACPFCGVAAKLTHQLGGVRRCRRCYETQHVDACARCGRVKTVGGRTPDGGPLCHRCLHADPINHEQCARCGRDRPHRPAHRSPGAVFRVLPGADRGLFDMWPHPDLLPRRHRCAPV
jgi:hypothetical protein